jgi:CheY-like chemotaxis protein
MKRILIIADDIILRRMISLTLRKDSLWIDVVSSGSAAISQIKSIPYDLILIDLKIPFLHIGELQEELKSQQQIRSISVIVLLLNPLLESSLHNWFDLKVDEIVIKPINPLNLRIQIHGLLNLV